MKQLYTNQTSEISQSARLFNQARYAWTLSIFLVWLIIGPAYASVISATAEARTSAESSEARPTGSKSVTSPKPQTPVPPFPSWLPQTGLVGWWPFNGNANDESGYNNNGVVNGAVLIPDRSGNPNSAYDFDGVNDYINVPDPASLDFVTGQSFTVAFWYKADMNSPGGGLISKHALYNYQPYNGWQIGRSTDKLGFETNNCYTPDLAGLTNQVWKHYVYIFDRTNNQVVLYEDGQQKSAYGCPNLPNEIMINSYDLKIGVERNNNAYSKGPIDDVGIWNRALTSAEIQQLYSAQDSGQTVTDIDGNTYNTVTIGNQVWMKENLRVSKYRNGDILPNVSEPSIWSTLTTGAFVYYNNDSGYNSTYGKLYNWFAVVDPRGLCPSGWHLPTDAEWTVLTAFLGGDGVAGGKMKSTQLWSAPNTGATNESGFSSLPGGFRSGGPRDHIAQGAFGNSGINGFWWTSTESYGSEYAWDRALAWDRESVFRDWNVFKRDGLSVRCLRDQTEINSAPSNITLAPGNVSENLPSGTVVGALSASDAEGGTLTYSLVSGTGSEDNSSFAISGIVLTSAVKFDFETKSSYSIRVRATDTGGLFTEQQLTISIKPEPIVTGISLVSRVTNGVGGAELVACTEVEVSGSYAFVVNYSANSIEVLNVSNPANPTHVTVYRNGVGGAVLSGPIGLDIQGNFAFVSNIGVGGAKSSVEIIDITDPAHPVHAANVQDGQGGAVLTGLYGGIRVRGNYLYAVGRGAASLEILDVTDPYHPVHAGLVTNGQGGASLAYPYDLDYQGNYLFVTSYDVNALEIMDLTNPALPVHVSTLYNGTGGAVLARPHNVRAYGDYAYITNNYDANVEIVNIVDPSNPFHAGNFSSDATNGSISTPHGIDVIGKFPFATSIGGSKLWALDARNTQNPIPVSVQSAYQPYGVHIKDGYVYVACGGTSGPAGGLDIFAIRDNLNSVTDIDGNTYNTVTIGNQVWMKENLRVSKYRNGDAIPHVTESSAWSALTTGAFVFYNNDLNNNTVYGKLYNWFAAVDSRGLCPSGWHLPSDEEWTTLTTFLGGEGVAGGKMKSTQLWSVPNTGATNESGFSGLPGGFRSGNGTFDYLVSGLAWGYWWSSSVFDATAAWSRFLSYDNGGVYHYGRYKGEGFSVRCLKSLSSQVVTFSALPALTYTDPDQNLSATASSGLPMQFSSSDVNVAEIVSGNVLKIKGAGSVTITASQAGNSQYASASASQTITIAKAALTVTANNVSKTYGDSDPVPSLSYSGFREGEDASVLDVASSAQLQGASSSVGSAYYGIGDCTLNGFTTTGGSASVTQSGYIGCGISLGQDINLRTQRSDFGYGTYQMYARGGNGFANQYLVLNNLFTADVRPQGTDDVGWALYGPSGKLAQGTPPVSYPNWYQMKLRYTPDSVKFWLGGTLVYSAAVNFGISPASAWGANSYSQSFFDEFRFTPYQIPAPVDAGSYTVAVNCGSDNNYTLTCVNGTYTINKAVLTVTAADKTKTYSEVNPTLTFGYSGFKYNETADVLDAAPVITTSAVTGSDAGTYAIGFTGGSDNNYTFNFVNGTLTVNKATLQAVVANAGRTYGSANPEFSISYTGFKNSETASVIDTAPTALTAATSATNVGEYAITATGGADNNYEFTYTDGTLTIGKATLTATADNQSRTYGDANPAFTISYNGFKNSETSSVIDTAPTASTAATSATNVGEYAITATGGADNNYEFAYTDGTLTIGKSTLTATADNQSRTYGDANPAFTISYSGFKNSETSSVIDTAPTASTAATSATNVGEYAITVAGGADNNYEFTYTDGTLTIGKATLTAKADNQSRTYGDANPPLTISYNGFKNNETASVIDTAPTASTAATSATNVGEYAITASGGLDNNYTFAYTDGTLTISKATLTATADNQSRAYGDANPPLTITYTGFKNNETFSVLDTAPTASTTATAASAVGPYSISVSGGSDNNYLFTYANGTLTIGKATLTAAADDKSKTYGAVNPPLTITYSGFRNNETSTVLDVLPVASTTATTTTSVGTVPITVTGGSDNNYTISGASGTLTINKAPLTATSNATKVYGTANPILTITYTGLLNGETATVIDSAPTATTSATTNSPAGTYPITVTGGTDNNYAITAVNGILTVTKAQLTATADNKTYTTGQTWPTFTGTLTGVVAGDNITATYTTTATASSPAGTYPITPVLSDPNSRLVNYNVTLNNGTLTITSGSSSTLVVDATATGTALKTGTANGKLTAKVTNNGTAVANTTVTFRVYNPANVLLSTLTAKTTTSGVATISLSTAKYTFGVYRINASVSTGQDSDAYLTIYDATGSYIAGGGWINSVAGAFAGNTAVTGKASFGFVARYLRGSTSVVEGGSMFHLEANDFDFRSTSNTASSLVVTAPKVIFRGAGNVNGVSGFSYLVTTIDGQFNRGTATDKYRIKIWNTATGAVVYDNQAGAVDTADPVTAISGGTVILSTGTTKREQDDDNTSKERITFRVFPNPFSDEIRVRHDSDSEEELHIELMDLTGRTMRRASFASSADGEYVMAVGDLGLSQSFYLIRITQAGEGRVVKVMKR